jgi:hypothetical protein
MFGCSGRKRFGAAFRYRGLLLNVKPRTRTETWNHPLEAVVSAFQSFLAITSISDVNFVKYRYRGLLLNVKPRTKAEMRGGFLGKNVSDPPSDILTPAECETQNKD